MICPPSPPPAPVPPDVTRSTLFMCSGRRTHSHAVTMLRCKSCGWSGSETGDGDTADLFEPPHDPQTCARRQTDPVFRAEQDALRTMGMP